MTDTERERIKAICEIAGVSDIEDLSDGFHTFRQLYYQRMMLFATIVKQNKGRAWKSLRHEDGELCFGGGWFIVGVDTSEGSYTYHYEANYYSLFDCKELERGKHWDGHTEKDVTRLLSLPSAQPENARINARKTHACDCINRQAAIDKVDRIVKVNHLNPDMVWFTPNGVKTLMEDLPSAEPDDEEANYWHEKANSYEQTFVKLAQSIPPEIIRCKDCEDYQTDWETSYPNEHYCATMDRMMPEDGFCSSAERREE